MFFYPNKRKFNFQILQNSDLDTVLRQHLRKWTHRTMGYALNLDSVPANQAQLFGASAMCFPLPLNAGDIDSETLSFEASRTSTSQVFVSLVE